MKEIHKLLEISPEQWNLTPKDEKLDKILELLTKDKGDFLIINLIRIISGREYFSEKEILDSSFRLFSPTPLLKPTIKILSSSACFLL